MTPPPAQTAAIDELFQAIEADDLALVQRIISEKGDDVVLEKASPNSKTPLMHACETHGNADIVQLLLSSGAPWNDVDDDGHCAGEYAAQKFPHLASWMKDEGGLGGGAGRDRVGWGGGQLGERAREGGVGKGGGQQGVGTVGVGLG